MKEKKSVVKTTKVYRLMAAILIAAMSIGFSSCSQDKKEELKPELPILLMRKWIDISKVENGIFKHYIEFGQDNTYSYVNEGDTINGIYRVTEVEKTPYTFEDGSTQNATLYKMLASGSNVYEKLHIYHYGGSLMIHFYTGNEQLVQKFIFSNVF